MARSPRTRGGRAGRTGRGPTRVGRLQNAVQGGRHLYGPGQAIHGARMGTGPRSSVRLPIYSVCRRGGRQFSAWSRCADRLATAFDRARNPTVVADPTGRRVEWESNLDDVPETNDTQQKEAVADLCAAISRAAVQGGALEQAVANSEVVIALSSHLESALRTIDRQDRALEKISRAVCALQNDAYGPIHEKTPTRPSPKRSSPSRSSVSSLEDSD